MSEVISTKSCVSCGTPVTTAASTPICSIDCKESWVQSEINQMSDDEANCPICDNSFRTVRDTVNHINSSNGLHSHYNIRRTRDCEACGEAFIPNTKGAKYCSEKCFGDDNHDGFVEKTCNECGTDFTVSVAENKNNISITGSERRFCSRKCYGISQRTHNSIRNTSEYYQWRKAVYNSRDDCAECGATDNLQAHHIVPISEDKSLATDLDNSQLLCGECHSEKHPNIPDGLFF